MRYDQPYHRSSRNQALERYSTRILVGFVTSLATVLAAIYMPLSLSSGQVGWSTRPADRITLSMVDDDSRSDEASQETGKSAPPPTRHVLPEPSSASAGEATEDGTGGTGEDDGPAEGTEDETSVRRLSTLSAQDQIPHVVGGMGALYLQIQYPHAAREQGIEGRVKLDFTVGRDGDVRRIRVAKSLHPLCDSAAVRALRSVKFKPARRNGEPIPIRMRLPIRFKLQSEAGPLHSQRASSG